MTHAIRPEILNDDNLALQAVWLIEGYQPTPAAIGVFAAASAGSTPYPSVPLSSACCTLHLGAELADFMQGKEGAEQALKDIELPPISPQQKKKALLNKPHYHQRGVSPL